MLLWDASNLLLYGKHKANITCHEIGGYKFEVKDYSIKWRIDSGLIIHFVKCYFHLLIFTSHSIFDFAFPFMTILSSCS